MFGLWGTKGRQAEQTDAAAADSGGLDVASKTLAQALEAQTALASEQAALATQAAAAAEAAGYKAEMLQLAIAALQKRVDELETALYLARSDQQRSAVLADDLRARLTAQP
jgi:hypothetical protein